MTERKEPTLSSGLPPKENMNERQKPGSPQRPSRPSNPQRVVVDRSPSNGFVWFVFSLILIVGAASAYGLWQLHLATTTMQDQRARIIQLEGKLALSDDSASQSLETVGAKVRELNVKTLTAESEIAKLWDTRNVNRSAIQETDIKAEATKIEIDKTIAKLDKVTVALNKSLTALKADVKQFDGLNKNLVSTSQQVTEQEFLLQSLRERITTYDNSFKELAEKLNTLNATNGKVTGIDKRLNAIDEAIQSFDAFRLNVNRDLLQLKQTNK